MFIAGSAASSKSKVTVCQETVFDNSYCESADIFDRKYGGTCYTAPECQIKGGIPSGPCAGGFGVCCLFIVNNN